MARLDAYRTQTEAWATKTNAKQRGVEWQFTIGDARHKLKSIYPKIKEWQSTRLDAYHYLT